MPPSRRSSPLGGESRSPHRLAKDLYHGSSSPTRSVIQHPDGRRDPPAPEQLYLPMLFSDG